MKTLCKKTFLAINKRNTVELVLGIFVAMILLVAVNQKYLANQVAEYLYFALIALIAMSVFDKTNQAEAEQEIFEFAIEEAEIKPEPIIQKFFPPEPKVARQEEQQEFFNLMGPNLLGDSLEFSF